MGDKEINPAMGLNVEIMRKVYGVSKFRWPSERDDDYYGAQQGWPYYLTGNKKFKTHMIDAKPVPDFENDPVAVFGPGGLVEKIRLRDGMLVVQDCGSLCWSVSFSFLITPQRDKSLCRAVCLAALDFIENVQITT